MPTLPHSLGFGLLSFCSQSLCHCPCYRAVRPWPVLVTTLFPNTRCLLFHQMIDFHWLSLACLTAVAWTPSMTLALHSRPLDLGYFLCTVKLPMLLGLLLCHSYPSHLFCFHCDLLRLQSQNIYSLHWYFSRTAHRTTMPLALYPPWC